MGAVAAHEIFTPRGMRQFKHPLILDLHPLKQVPEVAQVLLFKEVDFVPVMVVRYSDGVTAELPVELTFDCEF